MYVVGIRDGNGRSGGKQRQRFGSRKQPMQVRGGGGVCYLVGNRRMRRLVAGAEGPGPAVRMQRRAGRHSPFRKGKSRRGIRAEQSCRRNRCVGRSRASEDSRMVKGISSLCSVSPPALNLSVTLCIMSAGRGARCSSGIQQGSHQFRQEFRGSVGVNDIWSSAAENISSSKRGVRV